MKTRRIIGIVLVVVLFNAVIIWAVASGQDDAKPHWEYEGPEGPDHWGELDGYETCGTGRAQSPIDIADATALNLSDISFDYSPSAMNIHNNGHTIQVEYDAGSSITYNETTYNLAQFHFHHPSEHTINGEPAAMEIHFVHKDAAGNLAVVGILLVEGEEDNEAYAPIFEHLPAEKSDPEAMGEINAADLLPENAAFYTYSGSLTTPPCTQGVRWLVLTEPIVLSAEQIEAFAQIFELNARPTQPLNNRDLLEDNG
ncbi:MAG: carbonic anhydrase family protein [Anaerolineales bacterium]|nr:carbonic anhydrase family protein [Anaerolineales bacterium]